MEDRSGSVRSKPASSGALPDDLLLLLASADASSRGWSLAFSYYGSFVFQASWNGQWNWATPTVFHCLDAIVNEKTQKRIKNRTVSRQPERARALSQSLFLFRAPRLALNRWRGAKAPFFRAAASASLASQPALRPRVRVFYWVCCTCTVPSTSPVFVSCL